MKKTSKPTLIIVESPTKAKTIGKFLGKEYRVESSFGHIRDLPKSKLGIDVEHDFAPHYIIPTKAKKTVSNLKKAVKAAGSVILASDEDREGEAIAWHLTQALGLGNSKSEARNPKENTMQRIVFHEITKSAIEKALASPRTIDMHLVDAQQARRILDRLVGYKLSPFLWRKVAKGLSAGRVQSAALRLIVNREEEIRKFIKEEYWTIAAEFLPKENATPFLANLSKIDSKALEKFSIRTKENAERIVEEMKAASFAVADVALKESKRSPPPPFTTSTLQQESAKRLHFPAKKTMFLAQRLYEEGRITYMRTDSVNLSVDSTHAAKEYLEIHFGKEYAADAPRTFTTKSKLSQEAHEAVRPTSLDVNPKDIEDPAQQKLYTLIWQRFLASQMPAARIATVGVEISGKEQRAKSLEQTVQGREFGLRATGQRIIFDGFLKVWPQKFEERELPQVKVGEELSTNAITPEQHFTEPPPRFSEATLVKTLEEFGIGRPSTYAPTISVIQARNYVRKEKGRFFPTETGELVNKVLTEHSSNVVDIGFTAKMEETLDMIAEGKEEWHDVLRAFYEPFAKHLAEKESEVKTETPVEITDEKCEKCGKPMAIKRSRFGKFLACTGFPECRNTKSLEPGEGGAPQSAPKPIGMPCPTCGATSHGEIVERYVHRGRARGKKFWGCSRYPECNYASWENPKPDTEEAKEATATEVTPEESTEKT